MTESMIFYKSFYDAIKFLPEAIQLEVYNAVFDYVFDGNEPRIEGPALSIWILIKPQIDANMRRRENGRIGGKQTASKSQAKLKQNSSNEEANHEQDSGKSEANVNDNDNDNDNTCSDNAKSDAVKYYLDYINPSPSQTVIKTIESYITDGMTDECIIAILDYCRDNNKTGWSYIKSALQGSYDEGIRTLEAYTQNQAERQRSRRCAEPKAIPNKSRFHNFDQREYDGSEFDEIYFSALRESLEKNSVLYDDC